MAKTIEITPSDKGRLIVQLYGEKIDVTELADKNGKGTFKAFGDEYEFTTKGKKAAAKKTTKKAEVEPEPVEEPVEVETPAEEEQPEESETPTDKVVPEEVQDEA